jgi:hypothetical protein
MTRRSAEKNWEGDVEKIKPSHISILYKVHFLYTSQNSADELIMRLFIVSHISSRNSMDS